MGMFGSFKQESDGNDSAECNNSEDPSFSESGDSMGSSEASDWENQTSKQEKRERTVSRREDH